MTEPAVELLKKMIIHIPDEGFRCVRYYGFCNNKKKEQLERFYELMRSEKKLSWDKRMRQKEREQKLGKIRFRTSVFDSFNRDVLLCKCGYQEYLPADDLLQLRKRYDMKPSDEDTVL